MEESSVSASADAISATKSDEKSNTKGNGKGQNTNKNKNQSSKGKGGGKVQNNNLTKEAEAVCIVCAEDIDNRTRLSVLAPCGHHDMCSMCALRLRILHDDKRCPYCNSISEKMVVTPSRKLTWNEVDFDPLGKNAKWAGGNLQYHNESKLYMPHQFKISHVDKLISCSCYEMISKTTPIEVSQKQPPPVPTQQSSNVPPPPPPIGGSAGASVPTIAVVEIDEKPKPIKNKTVKTKCLANFGNAKSLSKHLRDKHQLQFCSICAEHKPVFCSELKRYSTKSTDNELEKHITIGDPKGEGFSGHPKVTLTYI